MIGPLLTLKVHEQFCSALRVGATTMECSLDLERSMTRVQLEDGGWYWREKHYPYLQKCKERTIYHWMDDAFTPVARYTTSLIKLVPTSWGPPTFEIDGIKMLPTLQCSPYDDARRKVSLIKPHGKRILDTCGGLGYFAACCVEGQAKQVISYEIHPDVIWLRSVNPWSPKSGDILSLTRGDITEQIPMLPNASVDAILHDPPRFGIAGELYSQSFYDHLARVLKRNGRLFHYTGTPNKLTSGRDVPSEVAKRLQRAHFRVTIHGDGVLAIKA